MAPRTVRPSPQRPVPRGTVVAQSPYNTGQQGPRAYGTPRPATPQERAISNQANTRRAQEQINVGRNVDATWNNTRWQDEMMSNLAGLAGADQAAANFGPSGGNNGGGGGGGRSGPSDDEVRALADSAFGFDTAPYDQMRAAVAGQRQQANAYNPDFAAMEAEYRSRAQTDDAARSAAVRQRLDQMLGFGQTLAGQQGTAMASALRDLGAQGADTSQYVQQANAVGGDRVAAMANQGQLQTSMDASAANSLADYLRSSGLIRQGGEASLANNRGTLLNQLGEKEAGIGLQQSKDQLANQQARTEFLLKYGLTG